MIEGVDAHEQTHGLRNKYPTWVRTKTSDSARDRKQRYQSSVYKGRHACTCLKLGDDFRMLDSARVPRT